MTKYTSFSPSATKTTQSGGVDTDFWFGELVEIVERLDDERAIGEIEPNNKHITPGFYYLYVSKYDDIITGAFGPFKTKNDVREAMKTLAESAKRRERSTATIAEESAAEEKRMGTLLRRGYAAEEARYAKGQRGGPNGRARGGAAAPVVARKVARNVSSHAVGQGGWYIVHRLGGASRIVHSPKGRAVGEGPYATKAAAEDGLLYAYPGSAATGVYSPADHVKHYKERRGAGWYIVHRAEGRDLGEGPWDTKADAKDFLDSEVGWPKNYDLVKWDGR